MAHEHCTICGFELNDTYGCAPCEMASVAIAEGAAIAHYHELLAEQIGNLLTGRNWKTIPYTSKNLFPRFV